MGRSGDTRGRSDRRPARPRARATLKDDELGYAVRVSPVGQGYFTPPAGKYVIPLPLLLFRALLAVAGTRSYLAYELVGIGFVVLNASLFFILAARRIGALALAPAAILLFFGAAGEVVATGALRLTELMAVAAGLGALICLESPGRRRVLGDLAAAALLLVALFCHPLALAFVAAALVVILRRRGADRWRTPPVALIPVAIWAITLLSLRPDDQPASAPWSSVPSFVARSAPLVASAISGATRLAVIERADAIQWAVGAAIVIAAVAVFAWRRRRGWRPTPLFWASIVGLGVLWVIEAHAPGGDRDPQSPRYLYPAGVLILLGLSELGAGLRRRAEGVVAFATVSLVALVLSIDALRVSADQWVTWSDYVRGEEAAVDLARDHVSPAFEPEDPAARPAVPFHGLRIPAAFYLAIADRWGSPAYTPAELARRPAAVRNTRRPRPRSRAEAAIRARFGRVASARGCSPVGASGHRSAIVPAGRLVLRASGAGATARLRRFGPAAATRWACCRRASR